MKKPPEDTRSHARPAGTLIQRRRLVKVVAAGGGVATGAALIPAKWTQPIIESVTLPVHAQTTNQSVLFSAQLPDESTGMILSPPARSPLDELVGPAYADVALGNIDIMPNSCTGCEFFHDRCDVHINTLDFGTYFGSLANPGTLLFDVFVTGPGGIFRVGVFVDAVPFPTVVSGNVVGNNGVIGYDAVPNGSCSPASGVVTPTESG